jgi:alpha-glucosidase
VPPDDQLTGSIKSVSPNAGGLSIDMGELVVAVSGQGARVTIRDQDNGRTILDDGAEGGPCWDATGTATRWVKQMPCDEHYFGCGERTGLLDKRGRRYSFWNTDAFAHQGPQTDRLYVSVPFFMGLRSGGESYGLFLNNTFSTAFDFRDEHRGTLKIECDDGELDHYVINGPTPARVIERFTGIAGRAPLPPRWALGYHQNRWSYTPQSRLLEIARELRRRDIPADVLYIDVDHMDGYRVFTWDRESFPDPAALVRELTDLGFRAVCVVDPGVKYQPAGGYHAYEQGHTSGYFLMEADSIEPRELIRYVWPGESVFPDFTRVEVRGWWSELHSPLLHLGIRGIWNDMNEPSMRSGPIDSPESAVVDPPAATQHGSACERTTHAEAHNVYGLLQAQASRAAFEFHDSKERPFILTRSGFAGIQRHAAVWTGDNQSLWEHLEMSLPQLMNLGLSGIAFCGADIGGFYGDCGPELLVRWLQLGAFYPYMRLASARDTAPQEPWVWDSQTTDLCRSAIQLRYRLIPMLYTLFEESHRTGAPVLRPLLYQYPADPTTHTLDDQAVLGSDLMVAPVMRPGRRYRSVYLPEGTWYDVRSGERFRGPRTILTRAALADGAPVFARGGAIIPWGPIVRWSDERPLDELRIEIFPDANLHARGRLYEDDGLSHAYQEGDFVQTTYTYEPVDGGTAGRVSARTEGRRKSPPKNIELVVHGGVARQRVSLGSREAEWEMVLPPSGPPRP